MTALRSPRSKPSTHRRDVEPNQPTVLITGASSGIGRATAAEFRAHGWMVFGTGRAPHAIARGDRIKGVTYLTLDYLDPSTIERISGSVPRIDALINNAGIGQAGALEDQPTRADRELFQINVFGPLELTRAFLPMMRADHTGTIIFVGSLIAEFPVPFQSGYAASKLALRAYAQSLRYELGPHGIRTTVVEPGYVRTGIADKRPWVAPRDSPYYIPSTTVKDKVEGEHNRAGDPAVMARHLRRLTERRGPLPPRTTIGIQAGALTFAKRFLSDSRIERITARRFGLTSITALAE
jgi:NAD(P)-dependent dehydrogenase (short-subunit alcohol dehydrogenase family)